MPHHKKRYIASFQAKYRKVELSKLREALESEGYSIQKFCENVLKKPYRTFYDQVKKDRIPISDVRIILKKTNKTFEEVFSEEEDTN